uniref:Uncharacterized protein n=1 Tax=Brassica oleracea TaxID=3712 RepID=A0A3P6GQ69_BRAOL|nr:unnamed protein product [Brassica oleracea]
MLGRLRDDMKYSGLDEEQDERSFYYGGASVPFVWESRPGTPKHNHFSEFSLPPPLTPPLSYYSSGILSTPKRQNKVRAKLTRIMSTSLFHDLKKASNSRKTTTDYISGSTSSSSSFSSSPHSLRKPVSHVTKSMSLGRHRP